MRHQSVRDNATVTFDTFAPEMSLHFSPWHILGLCIAIFVLGVIMSLVCAVRIFDDEAMAPQPPRKSNVWIPSLRLPVGDAPSDCPSGDVPCHISGTLQPSFSAAIPLPSGCPKSPMVDSADDEDSVGSDLSTGAILCHPTLDASTCHTSARADASSSHQITTTSAIPSPYSEPCGQLW